MGSNWYSYEFDTSVNSVKAKVEFMTINHAPSSLKSDLLMLLYLKQTDSTAQIIYDENATIKASSGSRTWHFINNSFLSIPYTDDWCKVGTAILQNFEYTEKGVFIKKTVCTPSITINGSVGSISIYDNRNISLEELPKRTDVSKSTFKSINVNQSINNTVGFDVVRNYENTYHRIRYCWGKTKNDYSCIFKDFDCTDNVHQSETDYLTVTNDSTKLYLNLLKNGYSGLSRANELVNKEKDCCVLILESYAGVDYLGNAALHLYFSVEDKYKPVITEPTIEIVNKNEIVNGWDIALQGYSSAIASCEASLSDTEDNAQIVGYEISYLNGEKTASNTLNTSIFQSSGTKKFTFKAIDSRGRTGETTDSLIVYPYYIPQVSFEKLYRCDENGSKADKGNHFYLKPLNYFASCNGKNSITLKCRWKKVTDNSFEENNVMSVDTTGSIINASLSDTSSYDVVLYIEDSLSNSTESLKPLTSGKVLIHFNKGGKSVGIGMYNYAPNTCKVGYDFLLGEVGIEDYVKLFITDFVVERGIIENGAGVWLASGENSVPFEGITWRYEKYFSGKIELWGNCTIENIKPYSSNAHYNYIRPAIPSLNGKNIVTNSEHNLVYVGGVSDCLAIISKGGATGFSGSRFDFLFYRNNTWTQGNIKPVIDFHVTALPK